MSGPWEDYQDNSSSDGPWKDFPPSKQNPLQTALGAAQYAIGQFNQSGTPQGAGNRLLGMINQGADAAGQKVAEGLASGVSPKVNPALPFPLNVSMQNTPGKGLRTSPQVAAGVGEAIQMAPDAAMAAIPVPGGESLVNPPEGLLRQLESVSGGMKGSLSEQFKNPLLMFQKGTGAAKPLYQAAQKAVPYEQTIFKGITGDKEIVDKAIGVIESGGKLEPQEALLARQSLDAARKKMNKGAFQYYRDTLDGIVKSNEDLAKADPLHRQGMMAESLRQILPQNKLGGASPFKTTMGIASGSFPLISPAGQSVAVGAAGAAAKTDPKLIAAFIDWYNSVKKKGEQ